MATLGNRSAGGGRGIRFLPILLFGAYFIYYYFSHQQETPFTGRKQLVDTSIEQEVALGFQSYQEILSQSQVVTEGELPAQVREIASRLIAAGPKVEQYLAETKGTPKTTPWDAFEWEVSVIESEQVNAFCLPGGKMAVFTGIIPVAKHADGLAAVMGHEIAHAVLRHGGERLAQQKLLQIGAIAANVAVGQMMSAAACFDPQEAPRLWERMAEATAGKGAPPEFASTHPNPESRIRQLTADIPAAMAIRAKFCGATP